VKSADRLIVALDLELLDQAEAIVKKLTPLGVTHFKVGLNLFTLYGPSAVDVVHRNGGKVFLDLKFHDIPNTVGNAVEAASRLGVWMTNLHAQGGGAMMKKGIASAKGPLLVGVTVLTSMAQNDLTELGISKPVKEQVLYLAKLAKQSGLNGIVASPQEAAEIRAACGKDFLIVTPGVRPSSSEKNDQQRTATPADAVAAGADYIVVGRPIIEAKEPVEVVRSIVRELDGVKGT
jgi:orotidine-5'-phosphate decarboxylase